MIKAGKAGMFLPVKVKVLMEKGVRIIRPFRVEIGEEASRERISGTGASIYGRSLVGLTVMGNEEK